jgi:hypothetical protein
MFAAGTLNGAVGAFVTMGGGGGVASAALAAIGTDARTHATRPQHIFFMVGLRSKVVSVVRHRRPVRDPESDAAHSAVVLT